MDGERVLNGGDSARLRLAAAPPALSDLVEVFWQIERSPGEPHPVYLPVPGYEVVACGRGALGGPGSSRTGPFVLLAPPRLRPTPLAPSEPLTLVGARLRATAMAEVGWCEASEALGYPSLIELLGEPAEEAASEVAGARSFEGRVGALGRLIERGRGCRRARSTAGERRALARAVAGVRPEGEAERRATQRAFARWVGMSPLEFRLVQRFDEVLRAMFAGGEREQLAAIAARLGYADQAHLTRQFRRLAWAPPAEFARRMAAWLAAPGG